jgi:hyperosmotically inducible protein
MREIRNRWKIQRRVHMNIIKNRAIAILGVLGLVTLIAFSTLAGPREAGVAPDGEKVRKQLVTLPYYGVFDNLAYKVDGAVVTLYGQVTRPTTRNDAQKRVARIEGVSRVVNNIEVLPLSSFDNQIRVRTYRAVFGKGSLYRYALGANPSIHIVVNHGNVTLEGIVSNRADSQIAYIAANGVPGVFSVTNNLRVQTEG